MTLLLTGDVEVEAQEALLRTGVDLRADVLKVPHHGSAYQSPAFLRAVHASVGGDLGRRGQRLRPPLVRRCCTSWTGSASGRERTDLDGDVAVALRNGGLSVVTRSRAPP